MSGSKKVELTVGNLYNGFLFHPKGFYNIQSVFQETPSDDYGDIPIYKYPAILKVVQILGERYHVILENKLGKQFNGFIAETDYNKTGHWRIDTFTGDPAVLFALKLEDFESLFEGAVMSYTNQMNQRIICFNMMLKQLIKDHDITPVNSNN